MTVERVAVLGCGPAGLLAAHAAAERGAEVTIFSARKKSVIGGAQYLHYSVPGISNDDPDSVATYKKRGTRKGYAIKVYGDPEAPVSWDRYDEATYPIWNMQEIYERLWSRYNLLIQDGTVGAAKLERLLGTYHLVVSSIPRRAVCIEDHKFTDQPVWIDYFRGNLPNPNVIIYSGEGSCDWYRYSHLFGWHSYEFSYSPEHYQPKAPEGLIQVRKPLVTNCDCWEDRHNFLQVGRFGTWSKETLAHEAFYKTVHHLWEHRR